MSVASEFDIQRQLITNAYNKLEDLGIDLTNVDKNIDNIAEMLEDVYEDYPKVSATGVTEATLDGTKVGKLGLDIKGNSTQDGTPTPTNPVEIYSAGDNINLFDKDNAVIDYYLSDAGVVSYNNVWCVSNFMPVYKIVNYDGLSSVGNAPYSCWYDENKNFISSFKQQTGENTLNVPQNAKYVRFSVKKVDLDTFIVKNNTGIIMETISNKNWFDVNIIQERTNNGITMTFNGQTINLKGTATANANFYRKPGRSIVLPAGTYYVQRSSLLNIGTLKLVSGSTTILDTGNTDTTFTLNSETIIDGLTLQVPSSVGTIDEDVVIMICKNDLDTTYIAHQEQTYTIPCQQPMRSIGTVRDEFIKVNGEWKERHNIASIILNGTEDWDKRFGDSLYNLTGFLNEKPFIVGYGKSNYYKYNSVQSGINTNTVNGEFALQKDGNIYSVFIKNTDFIQDITGFKTWLSTHNTEIIYPLDTPVDLPCTSEQIAILENLPKSYNEQTNIYSLDVTPAYIEAKALKGE